MGHKRKCTTTQARVEVRSNVWERIGKRYYDSMITASAFRPHDSEGLGDMRNKDWAIGGDGRP